MGNDKAPLAPTVAFIVEEFDWWIKSERAMGSRPGEYVYYFDSFSAYPDGISQGDAMKLAQQVQHALGQWRRVRLRAEVDVNEFWIAEGGGKRSSIGIAISIIYDAR